MRQSVGRLLGRLLPALAAAPVAAVSFAKHNYLLAAGLGVIAVVGLGAAVVQCKPGVLVSDRPWGLPRWISQREVRLSDLKAIVAAMSNSTAPVRYAGLIFNTPDRPDASDAVNLNLSFENGTVGFDWVMIAQRNLQDEAEFRAFARARGIEPTERSMNGVSYLRIECEDVAAFTASIVTEMYGRPPSQSLELVHEGFAWPGRVSGAG